MEKYLRYCLDSLLIKTNFNNIEVIVVNDGSKDSSLAIAKEYEFNYPEVFKVIDKENGNYGSCINKGLAVATGKYVKILDADDSFETTNFDEFVSYLAYIDADLVLSDFVIVDEQRSITNSRKYDFPTHQPLNMRDICCTDSFVNMQMHAVTYRRENLIISGYKQLEGISYTDQQWIFIPMTTVKTVYNFDRYVYKYLVGRAGQTMDSSVRIKSIGHLMRCMLGLIDDYNRYSTNITPECARYCHARLIPQIKDIYISSFSVFSRSMRDQLVEFDKLLQQMNTEIYKLTENTNTKFNYLRLWRKHQMFPPMLLRILTMLYLKLI